jgi:DNA-binding NtrC family response regulator
LLIDKFLQSINADAMDKPEAQNKKISLAAKKILISYPWPGNIRELYHSLLRASIWSIGEEINSDDVRSALLQVQSQSENVMGRSLNHDFDLQALLDEISSSYILRALKQSGDRKISAAQLLGFTNHQTLSNWMKRLSIDEVAKKD